MAKENSSDIQARRQALITNKRESLNTKLLSIQTKAEAEQFIKARRNAVLARKGRLSPSMQWQSDAIDAIMESLGVAWSTTYEHNRSSYGKR